MSKKKSFNRSKATSVIMGIASIILGILVFADPVDAAVFIVRALAVVLVILGIVTLLGYIRNSDEASSVNLVLGIIELVAGIILFSNPGAFVNWVVVFMGIFILVMGFEDLAEAHAFSVMRAPSAALRTVLAIITICLGVVVIASPFAFVELAFTIAGIALIVNGITEVIAALKN